tara:strand:+ start:813 stop:3827 length:3015 start_codon:yes stop_codon:yes gene_type:complete
MTIVKEYLELTEKYKKEYGEKTLVLMQVGSFFEAYGLLDKDDKIYGSDITVFAEINEMTISRKNICVGKARVVMAGFGLPQLEKYIKKMQDHGYTIPVFTQDSPSKNTTRSLYSIFSPGTFFSNDTKELSNNITCIWIHVSNNILTNQKEITIGVSNIDIFTGKSSVFQFNKFFSHNPATYDELERYISIYNPNECIIISNLSKNEVADIINFTQINSTKIHSINLDSDENSEKIKMIKNAEKQIYQEEIINRFYPHKDSTIILSNLQSYCIAVQAFVYLLDFIFCHNPNLVNKINEPLFENYSDRLILANHSLKQLNIIPDTRYNGKYSCVSNLLNNCITPMGKRNFVYSLLNPITNIDTLNVSYNITEHLLQNNWLLYRNNLNNIKDIEKLRRKLIMKKISPKDFCTLADNLETIIALYNIVNKDQILVDYLESNTTICNFKEILNLSNILKNMINKCLDINKAKFIDDISIEKLGNIDIEKICYINKNLDDNVDKFYKLTLESGQQLECIRKYLSDKISTYEKSSKTSDFVKIHETAKQDSTLQTTKRRAQFLKKAITDLSDTINLNFVSDYSKKEEVLEFDIHKIDFTSISSNQSTQIITSHEIRKISNLVNTAKNDLISAEELYYYKFIEDFLTHDYDKLVTFITTLDILQCKCYIAKEYNYCKPIINYESRSYVKFEGIRHCLIEHLNHRETYVTNNLELHETNSNTTGILLYGTNAVGKTSFIKAIGISIIMAQAGLYVPASSFVYSPYSTIFTRLLGNDNIFKGLSTFAVEMIELRTILQLANSNSLILGDELCSGTESDSALSIFMTGLEILYNRNSTFLFATHFHEIANYEELKTLTTIKLYHMTVEYDKTSNKLIYDRKLKSGPGESMYGLEVCKSLDLPEDFLNRAHDLRIKYNKKYTNILNLETSKYNSKKIKGMCEICKKCIGTEVHHLAPQKDAINNIIQTTRSDFNKNHAANLANVCEECHNFLHKNNILLSRFRSGKGYSLQQSSLV